MGDALHRVNGASVLPCTFDLCIKWIQRALPEKPVRLAFLCRINSVQPRDAGSARFCLRCGAACKATSPANGSSGECDKATETQYRWRALGMALGLPSVSAADLGARESNLQEGDANARVETFAESVAECDGETAHAALALGKPVGADDATSPVAEERAAAQFAAAAAAWQRRPAIAQGLASCCPHCAVVGPKLPWPSPASCRRRQEARRVGTSTTPEPAPGQRRAASAGEVYAKQLLQFPRDAALEIAVAGVVERRIAASARLKLDCCALQVRFPRFYLTGPPICTRTTLTMLRVCLFLAPAQGRVPSCTAFGRPRRGDVRQFDAVFASASF